jgi:hypothetical protein
LQYVEDYRSGNVTLGRLLRGLIYATYAYSTHPRLRRLAPAFHSLYDRLQALWGGIPFPRRTGTISVGQPTPGSDLNLRPGELVRVKSYAEILATVDTLNKNAGLFFDAEMVPFCGGVYRVKDRVHQFIDEKSGKMTFLKTPAVILDKVWCQSRYSSCRVFCPRSIYSWWREVWLERVSEEGISDSGKICAPGVQPEAGSSIEFHLNGSQTSTGQFVPPPGVETESHVRRHPAGLDIS